MITRVHPENNYRGIYVNNKTYRIPLNPSKPITELEYPEFLDIKLTSKCGGNCPYCYMDSKETDIHAEDIIKKTMDYFGSMTFNQRPFQVALGGGEPTEHPDFIKVLEEFRFLGITPNYTTNGMFFESFNRGQSILRATKKYCGGVAISCHEHLDNHWRFAAQKFIESEIKLNFHIIISDKESIDRFLEIFEEFKDSVDYFVLLPYGVQGRAIPKEIDYDYLLEKAPETTKIAFGANFHPFLVKNSGKFKVSLYEPELLSKFLDYKDMKLYPSSFSLKEIKRS